MAPTAGPRLKEGIEEFTKTKWSIIWVNPPIAQLSLLVPPVVANAQPCPTRRSNVCEMLRHNPLGEGRWYQFHRHTRVRWRILQIAATPHLPQGEPVVGHAGQTVLVDRRAKTMGTRVEIATGLSTIISGLNAMILRCTTDAARFQTATRTNLRIAMWAHPMRA